MSLILKMIPINVVSSPNYWNYSKDSFWTVTGGVAADLYGLLTIVDAMGNRPYVPAVGSGLVATFQRGDYTGSITNQHLTVVKSGAMDANFRSMIKISLTADEATNVTSGTVLFMLTEGANVVKWSQNWSVKKLNTSAGF